jgi:carbonic anhydrase
LFHIIICGHSHCGACASLYQDLSDEPHLVHVKKWLELGHKAKEYTLLATPNKNDMEQILRTTERISIKHQLENLLTYPEIYRKVKSGELDIHGWYYKIEDGSIEYYDGESCGFKVLGE